MSNPQVGFASFKDRSVELIFRDAKTYEEVTLEVKRVSAEDRAALSRILATCVFVPVEPLSTLSARVVEAAVRIAEDDRFFACATNGCSCSLDEADGCAGNVLTFDAQWKALSAAVDDLIAAREGR